MPRTSDASRHSLALARTPSLRPPIRAAATAADAAPGRWERLLGVKLAATAHRRAADAAEISRLAAGVDFDALTTTLARARLLPVLGTRLVATAPAEVPDSFRDSLEAALGHARRRSALVEQVTLRLATSLDDEGIRSIALKGPHLAERLYGDAGMRSSNDIDLLVGPDDFPRAVAVLERDGYRSEDKAPWHDGLPLFEASLRADDAWRPPVDLHWRLHWYEERFSRDFVGRSRPGRTDALLEPQPMDELVALLLYWCRDGLVGLRHAADIGAWWDRYGRDAPPHALEETLTAYPPLRPAITVAALHAEQVVGVPAHGLLSPGRTGERRRRFAARCAEGADPMFKPSADHQSVLVDALLTPRGGASAFVRRHLVLPKAVITDIYDLPPTARLRRRLRRMYYAVRVSGELVRATIAIVWAPRSRRRVRRNEPGLAAETAGSNR